MPPTKSKSKAAGTRASAKTPKVCDLCYDQLEESHEVLVCEGGCNSSVHRYCAGVTRYHYEKLTAGAEPFVCMFCSLKTHRALVSQLQLEVENLQTELASTKTALQESNQSLTEEMLEVKASMALLLKECNCSTTSSGPVAGGVREKGAVSPNSKQPWNVVVGRRKGANGKGGSGAHMSSKSSGSKHNSHASHKQVAPRQAASNAQSSRRPKVMVQGKRKVWGTLRTTTEAAVKNTIRLICKVDEGIEVKRKYRLSGSGTHRANSENQPKPHVAKWWFVISADESALDQLALSWSAVKLQTNWSLEPVFSYCDGEPNHPQTSTPGSAGDLPAQLPSNREPADVEIALPVTPDIPISLESSETLQNTSSDQVPDGAQLN